MLYEERNRVLSTYNDFLIPSFEPKCLNTLWVWEEIKSSPLEYYWRPPFIGDPHGSLIGDPQILVKDPNIFIGDPIFSFKTPYFHCIHQYFNCRPHILIGDTTYFHWRPKIFVRNLYIFIWVCGNNSIPLKKRKIKWINKKVLDLKLCSPLISFGRLIKLSLYSERIRKTFFFCNNFIRIDLRFNSGCVFNHFNAQATFED